MTAPRELGRAPPPAPSAALTRGVALLATATAVVVTIEFVVAGVLPLLARDLGVTLARAGWLVTWFALSAAILGPPLTMAASRAEPRPVLCALLLVFALGNLLSVLVPTYAVIAAVRVVEGAALPPFLGVGAAAVARLAGSARVGRAMAQVNAGAIAGIVLLVPAAVALADRAGWAAVFVALAVLAAAAGLAVGAAFPRAGHQAGRSSIAQQAALVRRPVFHAHLMLSAALFTAMFAAHTYLSAFLEIVAGLAGWRIAVALAVFGLAGMAGNWAAGRVADRAPTAATAGAALVLGLATAAVSLAGTSQVVLLPLLALWGAAHAGAFLICQVRVMLAGSSAPAFAFSLNISACNVGIAAGAAAGGAVALRFGVGAIGHAGAALAAGALLIALLLRRAPGTAGR